MRLLVIAFYFPPAGGGGVQRTLKLCKFLPELGVEVHVLAPSDSKWLARDPQLLRDVPPTTVVHRAPFLGPRASLLDERLRGVRGWRRAAVHARFAYQRLLIPDKAAPWAATAVPAAVGIVRRYRIDAVLTTSPPNSTHLIGAAVATATRRPWVADFRDSWLAHPHRRYEQRSVRAKRVIERRLAALVARRASALVAVTPGIAGELRGLDELADRRIEVIGNGADFDDFDELRYAPGERFTLVHAGFFFGQRTPRPVLTALHDLLRRRPELRGRVRIRFVGDLRSSDREWARTLGIDDAWEETGFLPYHEALAAQRAADALLLLIPYAGGRGDTVISGKVFEYLAAGRPLLAAVPPRGIAAELITRLSAGQVVDPDDVSGLAAALEALVDRWQGPGLADVELPAAERERLSRRTRAAELARVLEGVVAA